MRQNRSVACIHYSLLGAVILAGTLGFGYAAADSNSPCPVSSPASSLSQQYTQAYNLQQEKNRIEDEQTKLSNDRYRMTQSLYQLDDQITAHNLRINDLEKSCLHVPAGTKPGWCDAKWDEVLHEANDLNQQQDILKADIRANNDRTQQLDNRHDELAHQEYELRQSMQLTAQKERIQDPCLKQPSLSQVVECKYPESASSKFF